MKIIRLSFLLMLILTLTLVIASCDISLPREVENQIDNSFDKLEDRIENEHNQAKSNNPERLLRDGSADRTAQTEPPAQETQSGRPNRGSDKKSVGEVALTYENAESIAFEHAGVAPADALYLRTELELDDGIPVYEVEFYVDLADSVEHLEYEYTIHADTGAILEFDMDRD